METSRFPFILRQDGEEVEVDRDPNHCGLQRLQTKHVSLSSSSEGLRCSQGQDACLCFSWRLHCNTEPLRKESYVTADTVQLERRVRESRHFGIEITQFSAEGLGWGEECWWVKSGDGRVNGWKEGTRVLGVTGNDSARKQLRLRPMFSVLT